MKITNKDSKDLDEQIESLRMASTHFRHQRVIIRIISLKLMNKRFFYLLVRHNDTFHRASLIRARDHNDPAATLSRNEFRAACLFATSPFSTILAMDERESSSSPIAFFRFFCPFPHCKTQTSKVCTSDGIKFNMYL